MPPRWHGLWSAPSRDGRRQQRKGPAKQANTSMPCASRALGYALYASLLAGGCHSADLSLHLTARKEILAEASVEVRCVDGKRHACLYTNTHACPLRPHPRMDGPVVRWGVAVPPGQDAYGPGANRKFGVSSGYPKNSAKPPRARHASSEDTRAPGRRPAWRRARRGTNATCPSDATWQHMRLDMKRDEREASRESGERMHAGDANVTQAQARKAQVSAHASVVSPLGG